MVKVIIDDKDYEVEEGLAIIQACEIAGVEVPRFCYHEKLSIAGNCRMCLVDVEDSRGLSPKPVASCAMQVSEGLKIYTKSERVKNAQEGALEFVIKVVNVIYKINQWLLDTVLVGLMEIKEL